MRRSLANAGKVKVGGSTTQPVECISAPTVKGKVAGTVAPGGHTNERRLLDLDCRERELHFAVGHQRSEVDDMLYALRTFNEPAAMLLTSEYTPLCDADLDDADLPPAGRWKSDRLRALSELNSRERVDDGVRLPTRTLIGLVRSVILTQAA